MANHILHIGGSEARSVTHAPLLRDLLNLLVDGCQQAVRLRVDGRSTAPGTVPSWLESAASFSVMTRNTTTLELSAAPLEDTRWRGGPRYDLLSGIEPGKSSLDLLEDSLEDALQGREDSDLYDTPLMATLEGFSRLFHYGVEVIEVINGRTLHVDRPGVDAIRSLRKRTPGERRVMVAGKLETIRHGDRAFTLIVESGEELRGIVISEQVTPTDLAALFGRQALVTGYAKFRPSGAILRIEAERIEPASDGDVAVFSEAPSPLLDVLDAHDLRKPQGAKSGLAAIIGQWPGDETDEQVLAALAELS